MSDVSTAADKIRQAAQDMVTQDRRIAENAQKALEANSRQSKAALDATVQNFQKDERAWIGLGDFNVLKFNGSDPFQLAVPFINSGKSPAIKTEIATNYSITDSFPTGPDEKAGYTFEKANAIPPQGRYVLMIINRAVPPQYDAIVNGKSFLRFDGKYRYQDVYKPDVIHTTNFCLYYNSQLKIMTYCFTGNDMD